LSDTPVIEFAAETHPGNRYQHNEDSLGWLEDAGLWLVADGMGGHACGDLASLTAKQAVLDALDADDPASTIAVVRISGARAEIGWCGDSRVYLWRDGQLVRLTRDHSLLEQLLESGVVQPEEAFGHPQKHVLVQALGITNPPPIPAQLNVELANGDMLLMCSDGLHDELRDEQINSLLLANPEPKAAVAALLKQILAGPARDNISVVCMKLSELDETLVMQPPLTVAQLRERFERLPGRRNNPMVTPVATPSAASVAQPASEPTAQSIKVLATAFSRGFLIVFGVVAALVVALMLAT